MSQQFDVETDRGRSVVIGNGRSVEELHANGKWVACFRSDACRLDRWA